MSVSIRFGGPELLTARMIKSYGDGEADLQGYTRAPRYGSRLDCSNVLKGFTSHNCKSSTELVAYMTAEMADSRKTM